MCCTAPEVELALPEEIVSLGKLQAEANSSWSLEPVVLSRGCENLPNLYLTFEHAPLSVPLTRI